MATESSEVAIIRQQLAEAQATLEAIRRGEVDAVRVDQGGDHEVFTLESADLPYREFVEQMGEGALSLDGNLAILYCNDFFCQLVGVAREALVGSRFLALLDEGSEQSFQEALRSGSRVKIAATIVRSDGSTASVQLGVTPPAVFGRRRTNVVVSDLRALRRLARVSAARDEAERASHAKDRFLAVLGHELRNPLSTLVSGIALLDSEADEARKRWIARRMARQVERLKSLVDDLLDVTRIAQGKLVLKKQELELAPIVQVALESVQELISERGHRVVVDLSPSDMRLIADPARLEQIVVNLLSNAAKYTPPAGLITIEARQDSAATRLVVSDTGAGIERSELEEIFKPFAQVSGGQEGGLGIGLTLVRQMVELHDGSVTAESPGPGRGTTLRVTLPRQAVESTLSRDAPTIRSASGKVLIVDDNEDSSQMLALLLEAHGLEVSMVFRGKDAAHAVREHAPEVILLDIGLPDTPGDELAKELRASGETEAILVAVTGYSDDEAKRRIQAAGFDAHLVKPVTAQQILEVLGRLRTRRALR